jgi:8-oxo-dGTP pyrophosphatase MutT (NUDIX family)
MMWDRVGLKSRVEKALLGPLPGLAAQLTMVPDPRPGDRTYEQMEGTCLKAGILLLIFPLDGIPCLLFTKRTDHVLHHPGQISFPGGEQNPGEGLEETAVRETEEELGIDLGGAGILGALTPLYIPPSNYCVYPFVALSEDSPRFRPHPVEVAEVIAAPLSHLSDHGNRRTEIRILHGGPVRVPFFEFRGNKIWGATAMVLAEFLAVLEEGGRDTNPSGVGR